MKGQQRINLIAIVMENHDLKRPLQKSSLVIFQNIDITYIELKIYHQWLNEPTQNLNIHGNHLK